MWYISNNWDCSWSGDGGGGGGGRRGGIGGGRGKGRAVGEPMHRGKKTWGRLTPSLPQPVKFAG